MPPNQLVVRETSGVLPSPGFKAYRPCPVRPHFGSLPLRAVLAWLIVLGLGLSSAARAQVGDVDPAFAADAGTDQAVLAVARQSDQKLIIAGDFTMVGATARGHIARLNADGTLDPSFNPGSGANGSVQTVALQPDGKILVGGAFTQMDTATCGRLIRLNPDGSVDPTFKTGDGFNSTVYSVLVLPNGDLLAGGAFGIFNGENRSYLVRLKSGGSVDTTFNPQVNSPVWSLARSDDGRLVLGGDFTSVLGSQRNRVARLNADGTLDAAFDPASGPNSTVLALVLQPDGKVLIGGTFSDVNGAGHAYLCRLGADGLPDLNFNNAINSYVRGLALQPDGKVVVGGQFTSPAVRLMRLRTDGSTDPGFNSTGTGADSGAVYALALQPDGNIVAGGDFTHYNNLTRNRLVRVLGLSAASGGELEFSAPQYTVSEGQPSVVIEVRRNGTTSASVTVNYATSNGTANAGDYTAQSGKLTFAAGETKKTFTIPIRADTVLEDDETVNLTLSNPTAGAALGAQRTAVLTILNDDSTTAVGGVDGGFVTGVNGPVYSTAVQPDGKVVVTGDFSGFDNGARLRLGRVNSDGTLDPTFASGAWLGGSATAVAVQPDGRVLVGGVFTVANGVTRNRLARFNADGTLDPSFDPSVGPNGSVNTLLVLPTGDILVGGSFSAYNNDSRGSLVRIFSDGSLDPGYSPQVNAGVWALARADDGSLTLGGDFTSVLGSQRNRVARLKADETLDAAFDPAAGPDSSVRALALQADGKVVIGGFFGGVNGLGRSYLCRLGTDGLPDVGFITEISSIVYALALQPDGKVVVGGQFTVPANHLTRLRTDGSTDPSFNVGSGADGSAIFALALQPDGNIVAGGDFIHYNGLSRDRLVRVLGLSAAPGGELEFSAPTYAVSESQPSVVIEVRRNGTASAAVTVDFATSNGTANAGDYTAQSGKLVFAAGETKKTFTVPIRTDAVLEDDETVNLTLSNPAGGAALGGQRTAVLTILNDDSTVAVGGVDADFAAGGNGTVYATAVQPDGKVVVVGEFSSLAGGARQRLGRVNGDGTLDHTFAPGTWLNGAATTVAVQPDGRVLVGGGFTTANGVTRNRLARFNADGTLDLTFDPGTGPNGQINTVWVLPTGDILVGGSFNAFNNDSRGSLVRLFSDGSLDPGFSPQVNATVWTLARADDGSLTLGGDFTSVQGTPRSRVARLKADDTLDATFDPASGPNSTVLTLVLQPDGKVIIGGSFSDVSGASHGYVCRLGTDGLLDFGFTSEINSVVYSLALQPDGKVVVGGQFTVPANHLTRLRTDGTTDPGFSVGTGADNSYIFTVAVQPDGNIVAGGDFAHFNGLSRNRLVRVLGLSAAAGGELEFSSPLYTVSEGQPSVLIEVRRNGTASAAVTVDYATSNGTANAGDYTAQSGKLVFAAGQTKKTFTIPIRADAVLEDDETVNLTLSNPTAGAALGAQRTALLYILNDDSTAAVGGVDAGFAAGVNGPVYATAVQPDGKVMVLGEFSNLAGESRLRLGRLNSDGTLDPTFAPGAWLNSTANSVAVQPDGRVLVGGSFTVANGVTRNRLARFNADGTLDPGFDPGIGPNSTVNALVVLPTGDILVGGSFVNFNNESRGYLVRLFSDGSVDSTFSPQVNGTVWALARGDDGRLVLGGDFTSVRGTPRNRVARLNADGTLDTAFDPATGPNSTVLALALQTDGEVVIGGPFGDVNGTGHPYLCRLGGDGQPDPGFTTEINGVVYALALQPDGKVVAGGSFSLPSSHLARLQADGTTETGFGIGTGADGSYILTVTLQPDGNLLAGGDFAHFNGLSRSRIVRLIGSPPTVAVTFHFTSLSVTGGQVQLTGTAGIGQGYVLEYSRDFQTWFQLSTATATGPTLQFTDTNPTDDHRYYRVRNQ